MTPVEILEARAMLGLGFRPNFVAHAYGVHRRRLYMVLVRGVR